VKNCHCITGPPTRSARRQYCFARSASVVVYRRRLSAYVTLHGAT